MSIETYGDYQLLKRLATGGMAQIYLARRSGLEGFEKLCVVKRILPHLAENEEFVKMFLDEARNAARLNHPNIVQIFDLGAQDDTYYIAMEDIHGEDVRKVWKRADEKGKPMPVPLVCRIVMDACAGLDYAHKKTDQAGNPLGLVHRDISPQNIIVTFDGGVKVVDFGIAKAADNASVTRSGVLKGKYSYMSPEQASGRAVDCRTDIFALGVVFYELLTGTRLFKRGNDIQTLNAVCECVVAPPSEVNAHLPKDLDPIVLKALAKRPDDRYQEAIQLQLALEQWLLEKKWPSSSAHLAAFMQELYADRLSREAEEGQLLLDEPEPERKATPSVRATRASRVGPDRKSTVAERPRSQISPKRASLEVSDPADPSGGATELSHTVKKRPVGKIAALFSGVIVAGVAGLLWWSPWASRTVVVRISTEPSGATVVFAGRPVPQLTPCEIPDVEPGRYPITIGLAGHVDLHTSIDVAPGSDSGFHFALERVAMPPDVARVAHTVPLTVKSEPDGAQLYLDGQLRGRTPITVEVEPNRTMALKLEAPGYADLEQTVETGEVGADLALTLERKRSEGRAEARRDERKGDRRDDRKEPKAMGTVRFVVTPWAEVACGQYKLGETPFEDKQLPAGEYECRFTNPDLGTKTEKVIVRANETRRVTVKF